MPSKVNNARRRFRVDRTKIVPSNPLRADPTRSATLRRVFLTELRVRFNLLKRAITELVVKEDAFALTGRNRIRNTSGDAGDIGFSSPLSHSSDPPTFNTRFRFLSDPNKVKKFRKWLEGQVKKHIVSPEDEEEEGHRKAWWTKYIQQGYKKGLGRAFSDTRKAALWTGSAADAFQGSQNEFFRSAFGTPVSVEKVQLIAGRTFTDLKGISDSMSQVITRTLTDGLIAGDNGITIGRAMSKVVDISRRRAETVARTELTRVHAEAQLDAMEMLGVTDVGVMVEWSTAGDDRVCQLCLPMEGVVLKVKEARGIIPRHPNCRCALIPANVGESTKGQKRSKSAIEAARDRSLDAEKPKRSRRSTETQRKVSPWEGAGKRISKNRPNNLLDPAKVTPKKKRKVGRSKRKGRRR